MGLQPPLQAVVREVGPRDGLQSEGRWIETEDKIHLIDLLSRAGLRRIEAASFVRPEAVAQMRDAARVMAGIERVPGVSYEAIVPNVRGAERALGSGMDRIGVFVSATETHNRANVRMSIEESLAQVRRIADAASEAGVPVSGTVVAAFGCPYEGEVSVDQLFRLIDGYREAGIEEVVLGDTIGTGNPVQVSRIAAGVRREFPDVTLVLHFHDTRGAGLANVLAGLGEGITTFDSSIGGLGGCPYAPGATGNIATEDLVYMLEEMGVRTGVDLDALLGCARYAGSLVEHELPGHVLKAGGRPQLAAPP